MARAAALIARRSIVLVAELVKDDARCSGGRRGSRRRAFGTGRMTIGEGFDPVIALLVVPTAVVESLPSSAFGSGRRQYEDAFALSSRRA